MPVAGLSLVPYADSVGPRPAHPIRIWLGAFKPRMQRLTGRKADGWIPSPPSGRLPVGYLTGEPLAGPPGWWAETLLGLAGDGFDTLMFWPVDPSARQVELFADVVVPLLSDD